MCTHSGRPERGLPRIFIPILFSCLVFTLLANAALRAGEASKGKAETVSVDRKALPALPAYDYRQTNGLYATVTSMAALPKVELKDEKTIKLKKIPGFKRSLRVRVLWQKQPAPLVVLLLGLAGSSRAPLARLWQSQMHEAGFHVLVFDSAFHSSFNEQSRHGVPGHLAVEAELISNVIERFIEQTGAEERITKLGLLGASYGGLLALNVTAQAKQKQGKFKPTRVLAFAPPIKTRTAAHILDGFAEHDRPKYTLVELSKLTRVKPVKPGQAVPWSPSLMRAGIGHEFRLDLERAVRTADELYGMRLPPTPVSLSRRDYQKGRKVFTRYVESIAYPYWRKHKRARSIEDLWKPGELASLLADCPDTVHVVLAADDPLNDPRELADLKSKVSEGKLTVLPRGGHLGFMSSQWAHIRAQRLFE